MLFWRTRKLPQLEMEEIRKRATILVIDDQEFYYLRLFQNDGHKIEKWGDIEDLQKLEQGYYDVILLDIQGVGKEQSRDQGLGVLRHLRQVSPAQIIVAYSNANFSLKYQDFFRLADATLDKRADYVDFKRVVDGLLERRFSVEFYVDRIVNMVSGHVQDEEKLRRVAHKAVLAGSTKKLEKLLRRKVDNESKIAMALQVVQAGATIIASIL